MIDLIFDTKKLGHGDLTLSIQAIGLCETADSYYYAIDIGLMKDQNGIEKVIAVVNKLLLGWYKMIDTLGANNSRFLPFDFSDEYIGGLFVKETEGSELYVSYGFITSKKGWEVPPGIVGNEIVALADFRATTAEIGFGKTNFLAALKALPNIVM